MWCVSCVSATAGNHLALIKLYIKFNGSGQGKYNSQYHAISRPETPFCPSNQGFRLRLKSTSDLKTPKSRIVVFQVQCALDVPRLALSLRVFAFCSRAVSMCRS